MRAIWGKEHKEGIRVVELGMGTGNRTKKRSDMWCWLRRETETEGRNNVMRSENTPAR